MRIKAYLIQYILVLITIVAAIWVYDHFIKKPEVIESTPVYFEEVSYLENSERRWRNFMANSPSNFITSASKAKSAVVFVTAYEKVNNSVYKDAYRREKGSGVIISSTGDIITNHHVIADADYIEITLEDKREFIAEVTGIDESTDLALLNIEGTNLPHLLFANSDSLQVGEWILAVGNPFGLQSTVTAGIVSAKARSIDVLDQKDIESFIQTDAVINPGSSGGALVNNAGLLMGICTAILSKTGNYEGLSFAIPSNLARKVVIDLKEFGAVQRAKIGISITDVDARLADKVKLPFIRGVYINSINLNSAAAVAGLKKKDVITFINEKRIDSSSEFYEEINNYRPGDEIMLQFYRHGRPHRARATLRNYLNTTDYITVRNDKILRDLGIEIRDLNSKEKNRLNTEGVMIISVSKGSTIANTNMEPGYVVEYFNDQRIKNTQEFMSLLKNTSELITLSGFYERYPGVHPYSFEIE